MKKNRYILFFLLLLSTAITTLPTVKTEPSEWILEERGDSYEIYYDNTNPSQKRWNSAPLWISSDSQYVPYIFQDNYSSDGYYQVQNGRIGVRIYDYYAEFYSPDMQEIRLYSEVWEVQRWASKKWSDIGAQSGSSSFQISQDETEVNITKSFTSWAGTLEIQYIFREGKPLKHTVYFTSSIADSTIFSVKQSWAGIVGDKVEEETITTATELDGVSFRFLKNDGNLSVFENQGAMVEYLDSVIVEPHAQGMKADFVFSNWTLAQGEVLEIDPDTATFDTPTLDTFAICDGDPSSQYSLDWYPTNDELRAGGHDNVVPPNIYEIRSVIEWDISSIPNNSTILDTVFKYHGLQNQRDCHIHEILGFQPSTATIPGPDEVTLFAEMGQGTVYADEAGWPIVGTNQNIDLGTTADSDLESQLPSNDWFGISFCMDSFTSTGKYSKIYAEEYSSTPDPTLYVTYTTNPAPTIISALNPDMDDTDNIYAMKKYYSFVVEVSDEAGATDIDKVYLQIKNGAAIIGEFRATNLTGTPAWAIQAGTTIFDLDIGSCSWDENGNVGTATFKVRAEWDINQYDDLELAVFVQDSEGASAGWTVMQTDYFDIITRLVTDSFVASDGRINKGESATLSGNVRYPTTTGGNIASSSYPADAQFTAVHIHDSSHESKGNDATIVNGAFSVGFSIPDAIQINNYHVYLDLVADFTDGDAPDGDIASVIGDRWKALSFWASNENPTVGTYVYLYLTAELEYDGHDPDGDDILFVEGLEFTWDWVEERFYTQVTKNSTGSLTYDDLTNVTEYSFDITLGTINGLSVTVTWGEYEAHFYGLYNENGSFIGAVNVTAYNPTETEIFEVGGYLHKSFTEKPEMFSFSLSEGGNRFIYPYTDNETIFLFEPDDTYSIYGFTIKDYTSLIGNSDIYLEALRTVNGSKHMIERKGVWDIANNIALTLVQGQIYSLQIRFEDGSTYGFGYFTPEVDSSLTLRIMISFSENVAMSSKDVLMEGTRPSPTHIRGNFLDQKAETTLVIFEVWYRSNYTVVYSENSTSTTVQFNWYEADNETDYIVHMEVEHPRYPTLERNFPLAGATGGFTSAPDLGRLGTWGPLDGIIILPLAILLVISSMTDERNVIIGAFVLWSVAAAMSFIGWYPNSGEKLSVVLIIIVLMAFGKGVRRQ